MIKPRPNRRIFHIVVLVFLGLSPGINAQTAIRVPMGQNIDQARELPASLLLDDIRFIPLETNEQCLMDQDISKIELFDSLIFISDYKYIYKFDFRGKFLNRIGKQGRGPGEYSSNGFQTFLLDRHNRQLILFDLVTQRMIVYDLDGKFVKNKSIDFPPGPMEWLSEGSFAVSNLSFTYEDEPWRDFYILDLDAKTLAKNRFTRQPDRRYGLVIYPPIFYTFNGKTRYKNPHENIIFELDGNKKPKPVYYLDYGKYEKYSDMDDWKIRVKNNAGTNITNPKSTAKIGLLGISETESYLILYYVHHEEPKVGVYDKREKTFYQLLEKGTAQYGFIDDLSGGLPIFPQNGIREGVLYTHFDLLRLKEDLNRTSGLDPELKRIIETGDENDNPVVVIATLNR